MAATEHRQGRAATVTASPVLRALTTVALALPGVAVTTVRAADDELGVQYGHYQEQDRDLAGVRTKYNPIRADSLYVTAALSLTDRLRSVLRFRQDTWSGATPIATAPSSMYGNRPTSLDGISGASPYITAGATTFFDRRTLRPLNGDGFGSLTGGFDTRLVHTMSGASPETRKEVDLGFTHEWDDAALTVGGGVSNERDYLSRFANIELRRDFNRKATSVALGGSYTNSRVRARLDHDALPYIYNACGTAECNFLSDTSDIDRFDGNYVLRGRIDEWALQAGLTQVLNKSAQFETSLGFRHGEGYLANPYKVVEVGFIDPDGQTFSPPGTYTVDFNALLEDRPDFRNQWTWKAGYVQHIAPVDAALHLNYRFYHDDWGINAHTIEAEWAQSLGNGWVVTPRIRYYSQDQADFYTPYLVSMQGAHPQVVDPVRGPAYFDNNHPLSIDGPLYFDDPTVAVPDGINPWTGNPVVDANGMPVSQATADGLIPKRGPFDRGKLPSHYSSDHRLSGFGSLSGGITISKAFLKGVSVEFGWEYYAHAGSLKLGGNGEGDYADFRYYQLNAALNVDLDAVGAGNDRGRRHDSGRHHHAHASHAPAGVMFDHMLDRPGDVMVGYRYMYGHQIGAMRSGTDLVGDAAVVAQGCVGNPCFLRPTGMIMHMHMLDLMYAPTNWLNLMVMPQYLDMHMGMRRLDGAPAPTTEEELRLTDHHTRHEHTTGGPGDTGVYALFRLFASEQHRLNAAIGVSLPTGDVGNKLRDNHHVEAGFADYGMQLGSGTWDFRPSVTYIGHMGRWNWGAQVSGTVRLEERNSSGYRLGNALQSTFWGGFELFHGLSLSARGVFTKQGDIEGRFKAVFNQLGTADFTQNYGGEFWDVGIGLNLDVPDGRLAGNHLGVEWLQPVADDVNGFQVDRTGALAVSWSLAF